MTKEELIEWALLHVDEWPSIGEVDKAARPPNGDWIWWNSGCSSVLMNSDTGEVITDIEYHEESYRQNSVGCGMSFKMVMEDLKL